MPCEVVGSSSLYTANQKQQGGFGKSCFFDIKYADRCSYVAYIRLLRDAGVTSVDVDLLWHDMDINLDISSSSLSESGSSAAHLSDCDVGSFVNMMIGLLHCYYKDRTFSDPLLPNGVRRK